MRAINASAALALAITVTAGWHGAGCASQTNTTASQAQPVQRVDWITETIQLVQMDPARGEPAALAGLGAETVGGRPARVTVVTAGPIGVAVEGRVVQRALLRGEVLDLPDADLSAARASGRLPGLFDALRDRNAAFDREAAEAGRGATPIAFFLDRRASFEMVNQLTVTARLAGYAAPQWLVLGTDRRLYGIAPAAAGASEAPPPPAHPAVTVAFGREEPPPMGIGPATVAGRCDARTIDLLMTRRLDNFGACYQLAQAQVPELYGARDSARFTLVIDKSGRVNHAWLQSDLGARMPQLAECLLKTFRSYTFPMQPGACLARRATSFEFGDGDEVFSTQNPSPPQPLPLPLTWIEVDRRDTEDRLELGLDRGGCPVGDTVFASRRRGDAASVGRWVDELVGKGSLAARRIRVVTTPSTPLGEILETALAVAPPSGAARLELLLQR